eukprot:TRINITY_DN65234_c0_g1_i1.p1 TRINITY_DN65234_c0_g1~~TRINITY_DN65234_c0_g1_i1.p1  ORF type:complete len:737 (+),score=238.72 TRINITY_DN65234_c0_g1_i1:64-2274(+)
MRQGMASSRGAPRGRTGARRLAAIAVLLAAAAAQPASQYDSMVDQMVNLAQLAGRQFNSRMRAQAKDTSARVTGLYERAVKLAPDDPQAHITYATFLTNAQRFKESVKVWKKARELLSPEMRAANPALGPHIDGRIVRATYGFYSVRKDKIYAGGQGNLTETLRLQGKQLEAYPAPQVYYDRATVRVMHSETDPDQEALAAADFTAAQRAALAGWAAGQRALGVPCATPGGAEAASELAGDWRGARGARLLHSQPERDEEYGGAVPLYSAEGNTTLDMRFVEPAGSVFVAELPQGGVLSGDEGVVLSPDTACPAAEWSQERVARELARFYRAQGNPQKAAEAPQIVAHYGPDGLADALRQRYPTASASELSFAAEWQQEAAARSGDSAGCPCVIYPASHAHRSNLAANVQMLDVFGQGPDERGRPQWYSPQEPPKHPPFRGAVPGTPPLPVVAAAATVVQFAGVQFYHWLAEALGRVLLLRDLLEADPELKVVLPKDSSRSSFIESSLDMLPFRIPAARRVHYAAGGGGPNHPRLRAERLVVPTWEAPRRVVPGEHREPTAVPPGSLLRRMREALVPRHPPLAERRRVLWLARPASVDMRRLAQDAEVVAALTAALAGAGYTVERFEKPPPLKEAAALFAGAALVAGVHGGAFANTLFCAPGTIIVELGFRTPWSHDYAHLSQALGFEHHIVRLRPDPRGMGSAEVELEDPAFVGRLAAELLQGQAGRRAAAEPEL